MAAALVLAAAAAALALTLQISRYFLLLAALCYPAVLELAQSVRTRTDMMQSPNGGHYVMFFVPPLLLLAAIMIRAHGLLLGAPQARAGLTRSGRERLRKRYSASPTSTVQAHTAGSIWRD